MQEATTGHVGRCAVSCAARCQCSRLCKRETNHLVDRGALLRIYLKESATLQLGSSHRSFLPNFSLRNPLNGSATVRASYNRISVATTLVINSDQNVSPSCRSFYASVKQGHCIFGLCHVITFNALRSSACLRSISLFWSTPSVSRRFILHHGRIS